MLVAFAFLLSAIVFGYFAIPYFGMSELVEPVFVESEAKIRRNWQAFKDDNAALRITFQSEHGTKNDAGPFINGRIPWTSSDVGCSSCELALPDNLKEQLSSSNWTNLFGTEVTKGIDVSWLQSLSAYDHWDLFGAKEAQIKEHGLSSLRSPEYITIIRWAKIRLLMGAKEDSMAKASNEVRHLGKLIDSHFTLTAAMASISILKAEAALKSHLETINDPRAQSLPAFDAVLLERLKRVAWSSGLLVNQYTPVDILEEFLTSDDFQQFRCLGVTEAAYSRSFLPPVLRKAFLPERDAMIANAIEREKKRCRLATLDNAKEVYHKEIQRFATLAGLLGPAWARLLAGNTFAMAPPSPFASYDELSEKK